jgi:hypothetical protein
MDLHCAQLPGLKCGSALQCSELLVSTGLGVHTTMKDGLMCHQAVGHVAPAKVCFEHSDLIQCLFRSMQPITLGGLDMATKQNP